MTYVDKIEGLAARVLVVCGELKKVQAERKKWDDSSPLYFYIGPTQHKVFMADGTVNPKLAGVRKAAIKVHDEEIVRLTSEIEGLRYHMAQLGKQRLEDAPT